MRGAARCNGMEAMRAAMKRIGKKASPGDGDGDLREENLRLQARLKGAETLFRLFLDSCPEICMLLDADLAPVFLNEAAVRELGPFGGAGGKIFGALPGPEVERSEALCRDVLESGKAARFEVTLAAEEGAEAQAFRARVFRAGEGRVGIVGAEIDDGLRGKERLLEAQEELRALAGHIVEVREEERKGLGRELHDELGQSLTAIEMGLGALARSAGDEAKARERIGELRSLANQATRSVQRICAELRPAILDSLGLRAALEWLAEGIAERNDLKIAVALDFDEGMIGPKASTALFRVAQEAVVNIVRHARASKASISLRRTDLAVELVVTDDGIGIAPHRASAPDSFGLQGIKERARAFGGSATVAAGKEGGTVLSVSLPLSPGVALP